MASQLLLLVWSAVLLTVAAAASIPHDSDRRDIQADDVVEDIRLSTIELIEKYGYPTEVHSVQTDDGYILEMHRIPYGVKNPDLPYKGVVFLQHGLLCSSADWVMMGTDKGLAYILSDLGYDVWMGNSRGNTYSRKHAVLNPNQHKFWKFNWHEMGTNDIPAEIDYVLAATEQPNLFYIGHSQGTTQFYVMASEKPEYNDKIRAMFSLAPIGFMNHAKNPFLQLLSQATDMLGFALKFMGMYEFLPSSELMAMIGQSMCNDEAITQVICNNVLFLIAGYDSDELNSTMIPVIMGHTPAGAATDQMLHYGQEVHSGDFRQYEYGLTNMKHYGKLHPPKYDLTKITCPVALHYSENDWLSSPRDVDRLYKKLKNPIGKFLVPHPKFNHLDYLWAIEVKTLLYDKIISLMTRY